MLNGLVRYMKGIIRLFVLKVKNKMFLTDEQVGKYKIMSRHNVERYSTQKHSKTTAIISIKSSWDRVKPSIKKTKENNIKYILSLSFDDCEYEDSASHCMSYSDGKKVARFVNKVYDKVDMIIVHCDGGISRSAGVCAAIMRVKEGSDHPIFDRHTKYPNMTCYLRTLKGFDYI